MHYTVKADIGDKLAQLGSRLIDNTAKKRAGEFSEKSAQVIQSPLLVAEVEEVPAKKGLLKRILGS